MNQELVMSPHLLVAFLQKPASEFTKADIITYIQKNSILQSTMPPVWMQF